MTAAALGGPPGPCNRAELAALVRDLGFSHREARRLVDTVFTLIADALVDEEPAKLRGFGRLATVERAPTLGRDLATGAAVPVPARRSVTFRASEALRHALDPGRNP